MTVAEDIVDRRGRILVPKGAELSQRTVDALESWGIETLSIEGDEDPAAELDPVDVEAAKEELRWRFAKTDVEHPFVAAILARAARNQVKSQAASPQPVTTDGAQP